DVRLVPEWRPRQRLGLRIRCFAACCLHFGKTKPGTRRTRRPGFVLHGSLFCRDRSELARVKSLSVTLQSARRKTLNGKTIRSDEKAGHTCSIESALVQRNCVQRADFWGTAGSGAGAGRTAHYA